MPFRISVEQLFLRLKVSLPIHRLGRMTLKDSNSLRFCSFRKQSKRPHLLRSKVKMQWLPKRFKNLLYFPFIYLPNLFFLFNAIILFFLFFFFFFFFFFFDNKYIGSKRKNKTIRRTTWRRKKSSWTNGRRISIYIFKFITYFSLFNFKLFNFYVFILHFNNII